MRTILSSWILVVVLAMGCQPTEKASQEIVELLPAKPVINFSGDTLHAKTFPDSIYQVLLGKMLDAKALAEQYPDSAELAIWHGRRVAYLGRYHEAIDVFSEGIKRFPNDYRLLRHRGHRYLTTRQLDLAIADYEKANKLCKDAPNAIEPDGLPNKLNTPLGNDKFNIYYHQGLAYYLNGEFEKAVPVYRQCLAVSDNDDLKVATKYWLFMTLHRLGMEAEANALLADIIPEMTIVENDAYLDLLQLFKGKETFTMSTHPTYQYGVGFSYFIKDDFEKANKTWKGTLKQESWDSFGYIATEAESKMRVVNSTMLMSKAISSIFDLGELVSNDKCELKIDCECCGGTLWLQKNTFIISFECFPKAEIYTGRFLITGDNISLISDGKRKTKLFMKNGDLDSTYVNAYDTMRWNFATFRCNNKFILRHHKSDLAALEAS